MRAGRNAERKMAGELSGSAILEAVKHRANHKPIIFCSLGLVAVGLLMTIFGVVALLLDHAELGPPVYDSHYERYAGSSLAHILGKSEGKSRRQLLTLRETFILTQTRHTNTNTNRTHVHSIRQPDNSRQSLHASLCIKSLLFARATTQRPTSADERQS